MKNDIKLLVESLFDDGLFDEFDKDENADELINVGRKHMHIYYPKTKDELISLIKKLIEERGNNCDLNDIYTGNITDMSYLFYTSNFDGDISMWDVSNVTDMSCMFYYSVFDGDISKWDVSNVITMYSMFNNSLFNLDISNWNVNNVTNKIFMFVNCAIKGKYKPKFKNKQ